VFLLLMVFAGTADGTEISHTVNIGPQFTPVTNNVGLPKFNPALGKLTNVVINAEWVLSRQTTVYSFDPDEIDYDVTYEANVRLLFPSGVVVKEAPILDRNIGPLENQGAQFNGYVTTESFFNARVCEDFPPVAAPWVGTGLLQFKAIVSSLVILNGMQFDDVFAAVTGTGSWSITVTYSYTAGTGTLWPCH
jgi:hypothetical protein